MLYIYFLKIFVECYNLADSLKKKCNIAVRQPLTFMVRKKVRRGNCVVVSDYN